MQPTSMKLARPMFFTGVVALAVLVSAMSSDATEMKTKTGGPHYYSSFKTKSLPERPTGEISESDAKKSAMKAAYYAAYFDNSGRLTKFQKFLSGRLDSYSEYFYNSAGAVTHGQHVEANGDTEEYKFDAKGKLVGTSSRKSTGGK